MRIEMTRRVQMPPLGSEFDDFLYAPIGKVATKRHLALFQRWRDWMSILGRKLPN